MDWHHKFLNLSEHISNWSKDISTKVGAVIVDRNNRVISMGYNGFCRGADDSLEKIKDRDFKIANTIHAEENAVLFADRNLLIESSIYTFPFQPCAKCSHIICQVGIKHVYSYISNVERWVDSFNQAKENFIKNNVELVLFDREEM